MDFLTCVQQWLLRPVSCSGRMLRTQHLENHVQANREKLIDTRGDLFESRTCETRVIAVFKSVHRGHIMEEVS